MEGHQLVFLAGLHRSGTTLLARLLAAHPEISGFSGTGVPAEIGSRVFEPFVTTKQDGVGLGLALTKRIVEDHGGAIGYDPASGGTTFWIELPNG